MPHPRPSAIALALAAVSSELARADPAAGLPHVMTRVEAHLGKLIGSVGFDVLLARSVTLAAREDSTLAGVSVWPGGRLAGLPEDAAELERCTGLLLAYLFE